ncbi:hypothetical protein BBJ28_00006598 [Nothophytophthora sp. Chile5]|nr:hypothetical protein BBJ28_00006598 [Nothophytophthora sp. Chile5]
MESTKLSALASFAANQDGLLPLAVSKKPARSTSGKALGKASPLGAIDTSSVAAGVLSHKQSVVLDNASPTAAATTMLTRSPTSSGGGRSTSHKLTAIALLASATTSASSEVEPQSTAVAAQTPQSGKVRRGSSLKPLKSVGGPGTTGEGNDNAEMVQTDEAKALQRRQEEHTIPDPAVEATGNGAGDTLKDKADPEQQTVADKPTSAARATDAEANSEDSDFDFDGVDSDEKAELRPTERSPVDGDPSPPTKISGTRSEAVDIEELYDAPSDLKSEGERLQRPRYVFLGSMMVRYFDSESAIETDSSLDI